MPSRLLAGLCCVLLIVTAAARQSGGGYGFPSSGLNGRRMLAGDAEEKSSLLNSIGKGGSYTDWTVPCQAGRQRCPSLFLASHGYQCTTLNGQACCRQGNGKLCHLVVAWALVPAPKTWRGRDLVGSGSAVAPSPSPAPAKPANSTLAPSKPADTTAAPNKPSNTPVPSPAPAFSTPPQLVTAAQLMAYNLTEIEPPAGTVVLNTTTEVPQPDQTTGSAVVGQDASAANGSQQVGQADDSQKGLADQGEQQNSNSQQTDEQEIGGQERAGSEQDSNGGKQTGRNGGKSGGKGKGGKGKRNRDKKKWRGNGSDEDQSDAGSSSGGKNGGKGSSKPDVDEEGASGGKWQKATATYYHSYPPCCHDRGADQSECDDYSGCRWEGQFAGLGRKPESWVMKHDIVAFFEAPNSSNRKEWDKKWNGKKLRLKHPDTGATLDVTVVDTCDDDDCEGCCTENARKNGGYLIDLEINTARRFWGDKKVRGLAGIKFQILDD